MGGGLFENVGCGNNFCDVGVISSFLWSGFADNKDRGVRVLGKNEC